MENVIEFISGEKTATLTIHQGKYKTRIKKLAEEHPDEVKILSENSEGSILAKIPLSYIKISPPRKVSDKQKELASQRFKNMWEQKQCK